MNSNSTVPKSTVFRTWYFWVDYGRAQFPVPRDSPPIMTGNLSQPSSSSAGAVVGLVRVEPLVSDLLPLMALRVLLCLCRHSGGRLGREDQSRAGLAEFRGKKLGMNTSSDYGCLCAELVVVNCLSETVGPKALSLRQLPRAQTCPASPDRRGMST